MATYKKVVKKTPYNRGAYVPGGSSTKVAKAIQALGFAHPGKNPAMVRPKIVKQLVTQQGTAQSTASGNVIETPAQIEERVTRMAQAAYDRQKADLDATAAQLRKEAEGRQNALTAAYAAAAQLNAGFADKAQAGWNTAANTLSGLSGAVTGSVGEALANDASSQDALLSRIGAAGTGFDGRSQAAVEQYRGGAIPAEYLARMGGIAQQGINDQASVLATRGLQEGIAGFRTDNSKINSDLMTQVRELSAGRIDMETKLREQLLGARGDQIKAIQDEREFRANLAIKRATLEATQLKIDNQFKIALAGAQTAKQRADVYAWKAEQDNILAGVRNDIAQQNADANTTRAGVAVTKLTTPPPKKPPSAATTRQAVKDATNAGRTAGMTAIKAVGSRIPNYNPPPGYDADEKGPWSESKEFATARAQAMAIVRNQYYGTVIAAVMNAIGPLLTPVGYTKLQLKRFAYNLVSSQVPAPQAWLDRNPGIGPKKAVV